MVASLSAARIGAASSGKTRFGELTCANCHNVRGINAQKAYGPDLTHVASRKVLAGELKTTNEIKRQIAQWQGDYLRV